MAITFYATNNFTGDGTTVNWNINFADGYIDTTNVKARYLDNTGSYVDIAISSVAGNVVTISPAVANGQEFQIYRDTEKRFPLVDFSDGAILNETNLDTLATQAVMVSAEAFDQSNNGVRIAGDSLVIAQGIDAKAQEALDNSEAAVTTANGIAATANQALTNANAAVATANAANTTANGIAATANQALTNSATAISTANGAVSTANSAEATANAIDGKATTAINTANAAVATANTASTKADTAISTANSAVSTANGIDAKAQSALDSVAALDTSTMKKAANLSDIANKAAAWLNVRPVGSTPLAADPVDPLDATTRQWVEARRSVSNSWAVVSNNVVLPPASTPINGGNVVSEYRVGGLLEGSADFRMVGTVGSGYSARISVYNATLGITQYLYFDSNGDLRIPGVVRADGRTVRILGDAANVTGFLDFVALDDTLYGRLYSENRGDLTLMTTVDGGAGTQKYFQFLQAGNAVCPGGWSTTSDERIKEDIVRIPDPLGAMRTIKGVSWRVKQDNSKVNYGFIAQDVEHRFPDAVFNAGTMTLRNKEVVSGVKGVDTYGVAAALHHEAILALMDKVEALEARIAELTSQ